MKIPAFIKQLAKCCNPESSRYALGGIQFQSDGTTAHLTATDGRILATVSCPDDGPPVSGIAEAKPLAALPAKAFDHPAGVDFDGSVARATVGPDKKEFVIPVMEGRFPRYEDIFTIHDKPHGYVSVQLDGALLSKLALMASAMGQERDTKGITLFVRDAQSAVFASAVSDTGHVARMAIMPLASDGTKTHSFPARPGQTPASGATTSTKTRRPRPAPVPEMMDATQLAAAIAEPDGHDWSVALPPIG